MSLPQIDICVAHLNSDLKEEIHKTQADNFIDGEQLKKLTKLNKAVHALKQPGRE